MKQNKNRLYYILGAVIAVLLVAGIVAKKKGWIGKEDAEKVATSQATLQTIVQTVLANGKIQPELEIKVSSEISGEIVELLVKEGDSVRVGQLLAKINPEILKAGLEQTSAAVNNGRANVNNAKARLAQARAQFTNIETIYERNKKLYEDGVISQAEYQNQKAVYQAAQQDLEAAKYSIIAAEQSVVGTEAQLRQTRENLGRTNIYAPMSGIVSKLLVEKGEKVLGTAQMMGTEMLRIANLNAIQAVVDVSEADIVNLSLGDTAEVEVDAYPSQVFLGIVTEIANSSNSSSTGMSTDQTTNFSVKINLLPSSYKSLLAKNRHPFRPGMTTSVEIRTDRAENVLCVPIQAVAMRATDAKNKVLNSFEQSKAERQDRPNDDEAQTEKSQEKPLAESQKEVIFVIDAAGKAKSLVVKTGIQNDKYIQILSGIKNKENLITAPYSAINKKLYDGAAVEKVAEKDLFDLKE